MPIDKNKSFERIFNAAKPHIEKILEGNLENVLKIPLMRELFNISPPLMVSLLSIGIGEIKERMDQHPWVKASIVLLEVLPREFGRILEVDAGGTSVAGASNPAAAAVGKLKAKKGKVSGSATAMKPLPAGVLAILNKKFAGDSNIGRFLTWFFALSAEDQKKAETYILSSLDETALGIFLLVDDQQKTQIVQHFSIPETAAKTTGFVSIFASRVVKHIKAKTKHPKKYGIFARFAYNLSGNPIDKQGRRK